ncbi:hypothetical protein FB45DRAFT_910766 [Roridomyces roridus]|uniref:BAR-domain-containing protein n=1 Tax=Roridomyces roridus TaxID=1738132 RepID=A0AAD7BZU9_9AGAR|nr:hypothetical protein FB45DRAFT_910766 [Roridomyces roridus]
MAGKQLGKLRQWAGEVISSRDKTTVSDEFKELEKDVELRRDGAHRLFVASETYHRHLSKRKDNAALDDADKLLPVEALGVVMIIHGEEFGSDSAFGNSLVNLGRAHCNVAKLQETFAQSLHDNFMASLLRFADDIKEYEALKKKFESRRLSLDAANAKNEKMKNSKKDRERRDAEEDMQIAKSRYEETAEELEAHMHAIQENEIVQLRDLTGLLTNEIKFVEEYLDVLRDTRANWPSDSPQPRSRIPQKPSAPQQFGSVRSQRSVPIPAARASESSEDEDPRGTPSRPSSRPPSRPASRASRKRSDSAASEKEPKDKRRMSVAGWASSAVGSVTGRGKKSKEFASLQDDDDSEHRDSGPGESDGGSIHRRPSKGGNATPSTTPKLPYADTQTAVVRALYDFSGSSDELTFKVGDQIYVVNEVLDGWWMGELNGRQGLCFPDKPALPWRPGGNPLGTDEDHFGPPLSAASPFFGDTDAASVMSSVADDDDERGLMPSVARFQERPSVPRRSTTGDVHGLKKAPPPPPPRRTGTHSTSASPAIPERRPNGVQCRPRGRGHVQPSFSSESGHSGYDRSPFESATELDSTLARAAMGPKGMCSNCFEYHA